MWLGAAFRPMLQVGLNADEELYGQQAIMAI